ncbi:hypothetical protein GQ43DRAFT_384053 [Delitschia confertaspora ATCC 74209]|uniref:Heterokaryon incompatibility domain-containing protein n=1 Tax=Delitschia confertaspora ATCC 74209 TaxID=1513339 RepID=A0A9P4JGI6_9PLEO|nr:hypothetical protein GQ43DRAFT_384053 [Delitschia confertaspora ATCC 74209]
MRVLWLQPGENDDPIWVRPLSITLKDAGEFEALSYVWGDPKNTVEIECGADKRPFSVTVSLRDALPERTQQVQMMGLIYYHATRVVVWLGPDDTMAVPSVSLEEVSQYDTIKWKSLSAFFKRPWFERGWVIQEIGLANDALFLCGDEELLLEEYIPFVEWLTARAQVVTNHFDIRLGTQILITRYWEACRPLPGMQDDDADRLAFLDLLAASRLMLCSDPKDYVYAFLGHPSAFEAYPGDPTPYQDYETNFNIGRKPIIMPNYRQSTEKVYTHLARSVIKQMNNLDILSHVVHKENLEEYPTALPSWAPRWGPCPPYTSLGGSYYYKASGTMEPKFRFIANQLHVRGFEFDVVEWSHEIWGVFSDGLFQTTIMPEDLLNNCVDRAYNYYKFRLWEKKCGLEPNREAFLYTLTAGLLGGNPAENRPEMFRANAGFELKRVEELQKEGEGGNATRFLLDVQQAAEGRALIYTREGYIGLAHRFVQRGDVCCVVGGATVPLILRPQGGRYRLVSEAYVHGIMRGEAVREVTEKEFRNIVIY